MMILICLICVAVCVVANSAFPNVDTTARPSTIKESTALLSADIADMLQNYNFFDSTSSLNPVNWPVDLFDYDNQTNTVMIKGSYNSSVEIIPSFLIISEVSVTVNLIVAAGDPLHPNSSLRVSLAKFEVSGTWTVGNISFSLTITKRSDGLDLAGSANPSTVPVNLFLAELGESIVSTDGFNLDGLVNFSLRQTKCVAFYSKANGYSISLSGIRTISDWPSVEWTALLQRLVGQKPVLTMTAIVPSFSLAALVERFMGIDISDVPVLGTLRLVASGLVISSDKVTSMLLPSNSELLSKIPLFQKGVAIVARMSLFSEGDAVPYSIYLHQRMVIFEAINGSLCFTSNQLLNTLFPDNDLSSIMLPPGVNGALNISTCGFSYDKDEKLISIVVAMPGNANLLADVLSVSDLILTLNVPIAAPGKLAVSGSGSWMIGSENVSVVIEKTPEGNGIFVRASADRLAIGVLLTQFQAVLFPENLDTILRSSGFDSFEILNSVMRLTVISGKSDIQLYLSGTANIAGWTGARLSSVLVRKGEPKVFFMATGFELANANFSSILYQLTGLDVTGIAVLDQAMKVAVVVSPQSFRNISLQDDVFSKMPITRGLSVVSTFEFPADCAGDLLCTLGKTILGSGTDIQLRSNILSAKEFILTVGLTNGSTSGASLKLHVSNTTCIGIAADWSRNAYAPVLNSDREHSNSIDNIAATMNAAIAEELRKLNVLSSSAVNPVKWPVNFFSYDCDTKTVTIRGSSASTVPVIPSLMTLSDVSAEVNLTVVTGEPARPDSSLDLLLAGFEVSGTWTVGGIQFGLTITKDNELLSVTGTANESFVSVDGFLAAVSDVKLIPDGVLSASAGLRAISLRQAVFSAFYSNATGYTISLSGIPSISGWESAKLTMLLQRLTGQSPVVTMIAIFPSFSVSDLVKQLMEIDLSVILFIDSLKLKEVGLVISSDKVTSLPVFSNSDLLANVELFPKGVTIVTRLSLVAMGTAEPYLIHIEQGKIRFEAINGSFCLNVGQLLNILFPDNDLSSTVFLPGLGDVFAISTCEFSYDGGNETISFVVTIAESVDLLEDILTISDLLLRVDVPLAAPGNVAVSGSGNLTIGSTKVSVTIEKTSEGNGFSVRAFADRLSIDKILTQFEAGLLPAELETILRRSGFDKFEILNSAIQLTVTSGETDIELYLSGIANIAEWTGARLSSVLVRKETPKVSFMAAGFELVNTNFASIVHQLTGFDVAGIAVLHQAMKIAIVISPHSLPNVSLQGDMVSQLPIKEGLSVVSTFKLPADCDGDLLCTLVKTILGSGTDIQLRSNILSAKKFVITIGLASGSLSVASLKLQVSNTTCTGIAADWSRNAYASLLRGDRQSNSIEEIAATMNKATAEVLLKLNVLSSSVFNPVKWPVNFFSYDCDTKTVTIRGSSTSFVPVIPSLLTLSDVSAEVNLTVVTGEPARPDSFLDLSLAGFKVSGTWTVGGIPLYLTISKDSKGLTLKGSANDRESAISVDDFLRAVSEVNLLPDGVLPASAVLRRLSLRHPVLAAIYSNTIGYKVSLSGIPSISGWGSTDVTMLIQRLNGQSRIVTMIAVFPLFSLSDLVKQLTGIDISIIPIIGNLILKEVGLVISSDKVNSINFGNNNVLLANVELFQKGVTIVARLSLVSAGDAVPYAIRLSQRKVTFEAVTRSHCFTVDQLLKTFIPGSGPLPIVLPPGVPDIFPVAVCDFSYDGDEKSISVVLVLDTTVNLIPGILTVSDFTVTVTVSLSLPRKIVVSGNGSWTIGSTKLFLTVEQDVDGDNFFVRAFARKIAFNEILTQIGAAFLPHGLDSILCSSGLDSIKILNPLMEFSVASGVNDIQLHLSGVPSFAGWNDVFLKAVFVKNGLANAAVAAGFEFAKIKMTALLRYLTGVDASLVSLLDQEMKSAVIVSPQLISDLTIEGDLLGDISVAGGISIVSEFMLPDDCGGNLLCQFIKPVLGSNALLRSTITSPRKIVLTVDLTDISLGAGLTLSPVAFEIQLGIVTSVGLTATLTLQKHSLQFRGTIKIAVHGLLMAMTMQGGWERPFGIPYLAFHNLMISMTISPGGYISGLQLGGEVRIGAVNSGRELIGKSYIGYDERVLSNNYYYASINKLSVRAILNAFGISASLPPVLSESGFPDGISSSFAYEDVEPVPGIVIPKGFKLNGTLAILGFRLSALVSVEYPNGLEIVTFLGPINLANGLFQLYRSQSDSKHGPRLEIVVKTLPPSLSVKASGFVRVLYSIQVSAELEITHREYIISVSGRLFLFNVHLRLSAPYGPLSSLSFSVYGRLVSGLDSIKNAALDILKKTADIGSNALSVLQRQVDKANAVFDSAMDRLDDVKRLADAAKGVFDRTSRVLRSAQAKVDGLCRIRSCNSWCVGCPGWNGCCTKVWGKCIGCPKWRSCCTRVTDPVCLAANAACSLVRKGAYLALEVAKKPFQAASRALDIAKSAVDVAKVIVDKSRIALDVVKAALEAAKRTYKVAIDVVDGIARRGLDNLISIRKIEFTAAIDRVQTGSFGGSMEATLNGVSIKFGFALNLKNVGQMARNLADRTFRGSTRILDRFGRKRRDSIVDTSRVVRAIPLHSLYRRSNVGNDVYIDIVEHSVKVERIRRALEQQTMQREASMLRSAVKGTNCVPQQSIYLSVEDLCVDRLSDSPETREEACLQIYTMMSILQTVSHVVQNISRGWKLSLEAFSLQAAKIAVAHQTSDNTTSEDMNRLGDAVNEWKSEAQRYLSHQNDDALRVALDGVLGHEVERLTGMKMRVYLNRVMDALKRPYTALPSKNNLNRNVVDIIDETAPMVKDLFDKTIEAASSTIDTLVNALARLQRATEEFCG